MQILLVQKLYKIASQHLRTKYAKVVVKFYLNQNNDLYFARNKNFKQKVLNKMMILKNDQYGEV